MSDGEAASSGERTSIGVVAPETDTDRIIEAITDAGGVADASAAEVATESDAVVAVGDSALSDLADAAASTPILPVAVEGLDSVPAENAQRAIERVLAGEHDTRKRPLVRVEVGEESGRALFDVALTTAEPATISEFAIETPREASGHDSTNENRPVARVRADGVVVATQAGSRGYARAAGGPVVVPGSDVLSVVPVAPFATDPDHWVLPLSGLSLTIERDETDVELFTDGRPLCTVAPGATVRLVRDGDLRIATVPESDEGRE